MASLRAAKRSIRIQALIFRGDEAGLRVAEALKQKKRSGLDVRVIVDAASNLDWQTQWMYFDLKQHGIAVEGYEALYLEWATADVKPSDPLRPNKRFHDKLWVVDGEEPGGLAVVGGRNIANEYFRIAAGPVDRWRDQDVELRGPIVGDVVASFERNFEYFKGLKARLPKTFNPDNAWNLTRETILKIGQGKAAARTKGDLAVLAEATAARRVDLTFQPLVARFIQNRPRFRETFIPQAYLQEVDAATKTLFLANAYFVPSRAFADALRRAVQRGVRVVVITNSPESNDISEIAAVSRYLYRDLLGASGPDGGRAGPGSLEIREWRGPSAQEGTLHAKYAVVDGREALVGSYNLDPRSERLNSETVLALRSPELAAQLEKTFLEDDLPKSAPISLDQANAFRRPAGIDEKFKLLYSLGLRDWL